MKLQQVINTTWETEYRIVIHHTKSDWYEFLDFDYTTNDHKDMYEKLLKRDAVATCKVSGIGISYNGHLEINVNKAD